MLLVGGKGLLPLSFTNISGGAARHEKVSPKKWRILAFADAIWSLVQCLSLQVFTTDQPRSRAFKKTFSPPVFLQKVLWLGCFRGKNRRKNSFFLLVDARVCKNNVEMFILAGKRNFQFYIVLLAKFAF